MDFFDLQLQGAEKIRFYVQIIALLISIALLTILLCCSRNYAKQRAKEQRED